MQRKVGEEDTQVIKTQQLALFSNASAVNSCSMNPLFPQNVFLQPFLRLSMWISVCTVALTVSLGKTQSVLLIGQGRDGQLIFHKM